MLKILQCLCGRNLCITEKIFCMGHFFAYINHIFGGCQNFSRTGQASAYRSFFFQVLCPILNLSIFYFCIHFNDVKIKVLLLNDIYDILCSHTLYLSIFICPSDFQSFALFVILILSMNMLYRSAYLNVCYLQYLHFSRWSLSGIKRI